MSEEDWRRDMTAAVNTKRKQSSRDQGIFSGLLGHTHLQQENSLRGGCRQGGKWERARERERARARSRARSRARARERERKRAREREREERERGTPERWWMARQSPE